MRRHFLTAIFLGALFLQGCETTKPVCVDPNTNTAMCQPPASSSKNPITRLDEWMQEHLW